MHTNAAMEDPALATPASVEVPDVTTTNPELALRNLNSQIAESERMLVLSPQNSALRSSLVNLLLSRTQYLGTYADFQRVDTLTFEWLTREPKLAEAHAARASFFGSVHLFDDARKELENAVALGAVRDVTALSTLDLATGTDLESVLQQRSELALRYPSYRTLVDRAGAEAALGKFEQADASYVEALHRYRDVSPFPVAWVLFQRGVMWSEAANRRDLGEALYRSAISVLPNYVVANVHLAELELTNGHVAEAQQRLEHIRSQTQDPEPSAVLAKSLLDSDPERARTLRDETELAYDALLSLYPAAFRDHAAEFFSGVGQNPTRAVELALTNLADRHTPRAYIVALNAAHAASDVALECRLTREARAFQSASRNLAILLEKLAPNCD